MHSNAIHSTGGREQKPKRTNSGRVLSPLMATLSMLERIDRKQTSNDKHRNPYYSRWEGHGLTLPPCMNGIPQWLKEVGIVDYRNSLIEPSIRAMSIGLDWNDGYDAGMMVLLFDGNLAVVDTVSTDQHQSRCGSVTHSQNKHGGQRQRLMRQKSIDDDTVTVQLNSVPFHVQHILFVLAATNYPIPMARGERVQLKVRKGGLKKGMKVANTVTVTRAAGRSVAVGLLTRKAAYWSFKPINVAVAGVQSLQISQDGAIRDCLAKNPFITPVVRSITVQVLRGRNLEPKDQAGMLNRTATADPYFIIKYKKKTFASKHVSKTLNPTWNEAPFHLGHVIETEQKALKITIFDYDVVSTDEFQGVVRIPVAAIFNAGPGRTTCTFPLGPSKQKEFRSQPVSGEIDLQFEVTEVQASTPLSSLHSALV